VLGIWKLIEELRMLFIVTFVFAMSSASLDFIATAIKNYENVESYRVTLKSGTGDSHEEIRYYFKKPGFVRMEFIKPYKGAVLVYSPITKKARLMLSVF
jgi:outer membrane lipoprotein-sorting protein